MSDKNLKTDSIGNYACIVQPWSSIHPEPGCGYGIKQKRLKPGIGFSLVQ
jgi:hypothetical protein